MQQEAGVFRLLIDLRSLNWKLLLHFTSAIWIVLSVFLCTSDVKLILKYNKIGFKITYSLQPLLPFLFHQLLQMLSVLQQKRIEVQILLECRWGLICCPKDPQCQPRSRILNFVTRILVRLLGIYWSCNGKLVQNGNLRFFPIDIIQLPALFLAVSIGRGPFWKTYLY